MTNALAEPPGLTEPRVQIPQPATPESSSSADKLRLLHSLQLHRVERESKNEELLQSHEELATVTASFADLYNFAPVAYVTLN